MLLDKCDKIVVFGSTIGVEATFANKVSILAGKALYEDLDICYVASDRSDLKNLILNRDLKPKPAKNSIPYAHWSITFGQNFKYYDAINLSKGKFKGVLIQGGKFAMYLNAAETLLRTFIQVLQGRLDKKQMIQRLRNKLSS
ncbi:hypothetical protein [Bdellovibrio bacteriovorus]|uniref:hypothetical protein n=1 Tax=Bdellovibrio bacteriovorus TaxID=959 RepID=UPI0035A72F09